MAKKDGIVYGAFDNLEDIHEIRVRLAESGNTEMTIRNYIPPQIFERYMYPNKVCTSLRERNSLLKTQLRFGRKDIEVLTKTKGNNEPYRIIETETLIDMRDLPNFDHSKKWIKRIDRPPRRRFFHYHSVHLPISNPSFSILQPAE